MSQPPPTPDDLLTDSGRRVLEGLALDVNGRTASLAERIATKELPGIGIAVLDGDEIAWVAAAGVANRQTGEPVTAKTRFQAASISKPVTALAVMRLVQDGRLDLDTDVNAYLRSWRVPANGDWQPMVTLRQLLSHTAGTTVHGFVGYRPEGPVPTLTDVLDGRRPANSDPIRVSALPGTIFRYSGGGTTIVQQVLEDVTGVPFASLMDDLVLGPLGMADSTFARLLPTQGLPNLAYGHRCDREVIGGGWQIYPEQAAAGLWTTPSDLLKAAREVQRALATGAGEFLSRASAETMLTPQNGGPVGIGFFLGREGAKQRFSHGGGNEGFTCVLEAYARHGKALAVMTNGDIGFELFGEIMGAVARDHDWPLEPGTRDGNYVGADRGRMTYNAVSAFVGRYE